VRPDVQALLLWQQMQMSPLPSRSVNCWMLLFKIFWLTRNTGSRAALGSGLTATDRRPGIGCPQSPRGRPKVPSPRAHLPPASDMGGLGAVVEGWGVVTRWNLASAARSTRIIARL
jgi:hypothetical protein